MGVQEEHGFGFGFRIGLDLDARRNWTLGVGMGVQQEPGFGFRFGFGFGFASGLDLGHLDLDSRLDCPGRLCDLYLYFHSDLDSDLDSRPFWTCPEKLCDLYWDLYLDVDLDLDHRGWRRAIHFGFRVGFGFGLGSHGSGERFCDLALDSDSRPELTCLEPLSGSCLLLFYRSSSGIPDALPVEFLPWFWLSCVQTALRTSEWSRVVALDGISWKVFVGKTMLLHGSGMAPLDAGQNSTQFVHTNASSSNDF